MTPRRGRLTPLGLAGGWGAACPGLVPWGLPGSKHRPRGGLGTRESQWGAEPLAAKASAALDSVFFPGSFMVGTHSFDIGENSTLEAPGLSKLAGSEGEFSLGIHIIP